jgi:hypothetical protein
LDAAGSYFSDFGGGFFIKIHWQLSRKLGQITQK